LLPNLAEYAKTSQWDIYSQRLISSINIIALLTIPITFFSLAEGQNMIRLIFQNRSFDETSVSLTLSAFMFHMPGLFFIALNRVLAPAFYAQSNTKSPTLAGIISFAANICLAVILVGPFKGAGIALALSLASAVNTVLLLVFLMKNPNITLSSMIGSALTYILKLLIISGLAVVPVYFISPLLQTTFAGNGRLIAYGIPLAINVIIYAVLGVLMLVILKDQYLLGIVKVFTRRHRGHGEHGGREE
jgi:putative peptidoglycan lipid II flippase